MLKNQYKYENHFFKRWAAFASRLRNEAVSIYGILKGEKNTYDCIITEEMI